MPDLTESNLDFNFKKIINCVQIVFNTHADKLRADETTR